MTRVGVRLMSEQSAENARFRYAYDHDFIGVAGHPDDDECTHRVDGTDATYCGLPAARHLDDATVATLAADVGYRVVPAAEHDAIRLRAGASEKCHRPVGTYPCAPCNGGKVAGAPGDRRCPGRVTPPATSTSEEA